VEFSPELRERVLAGDITVSFRLWRRARVKAGGRYRVGHGQIEVESVEVIPFGAITAADVRHAGEQSREALRQRAAHSGPIADDTLLFRIEFRTIGFQSR
jgi:ASCH domain